MKNYKHSVKSNNAMKLAAVASAAIMMAPVALNSVSTFASYGSVTNNQSQTTTTSTESATFTTDVAKQAKNADAKSDAYYKAVVAAQAAINSLDSSAKYKYAKDYNAALDDYKTLSGFVSQYANADGTATQTFKDYATKADDAATAYAKIKATKGAKAEDVAKAKTDADNAAALYNSAKNALTQGLAGIAVASIRVTSLTNEMTAKTPAGALKASIAKAQKAADAVKASHPGYYAVLTANIKAAQAKLDSGVNGTQKDSFSYAKQSLDGTVARINNEIAAGTAAASKKKTGVLKVTYVKGYGIQVWTKDGKMVASDAKGAKAGDKKKLQDGTSWKVFGPAVTVNGHKMYNVGGNQYVDAQYVAFTPSAK